MNSDFVSLLHNQCVNSNLQINVLVNLKKKIGAMLNIRFGQSSTMFFLWLCKGSNL